jgi:sigma-B regulation protein RsbU (phosphoserine phosphatase)
MLRYVNAGHNPPIVSRPHSAEREILRLDAGGTVIGLFSDSPFEESSLQLLPGDVLVLFTDGVSEAMDTRDEEWGEDRLIKALRDCDSRTAADMISAVLERVDGFTASAPQHDDMTLVVVRVS